VIKDSEIPKLINFEIMLDQCDTVSLNFDVGMQPSGDYSNIGETLTTGLKSHTVKVTGDEYVTITLTFKEIASFCRVYANLCAFINSDNDNANCPSHSPEYNSLVSNTCRFYNNEWNP